MLSFKLAWHTICSVVQTTVNHLQCIFLIIKEKDHPTQPNK